MSASYDDMDFPTTAAHIRMNIQDTPLKFTSSSVTNIGNMKADGLTYFQCNGGLHFTLRPSDNERMRAAHNITLYPDKNFGLKGARK